MTYYNTSIQRSMPISRYCFLVNGLGVKDRFHRPACFRSDSFIFQFLEIRGGWVVLSSDTYSHPWAAAAHYICGERGWLRDGTAGVGKLTYRGGMCSVTKWTCMKFDMFPCVGCKWFLFRVAFWIFTIFYWICQVGFPTLYRIYEITCKCILTFIPCILMLSKFYLFTNWCTSKLS